MSEVLLQQILSELQEVKSGQQGMEKRFDKVDERLHGIDFHTNWTLNKVP